jgi:hypothetical protein
VAGSAAKMSKARRAVLRLSVMGSLSTVDGRGADRRRPTRKFRDPSRFALG